MIFLELFWTFFKIGLFTFGGGYAMIPLIQSEVVSRGWLTSEQIIDFIAVSESTPGPFAINMATFVGVRTGGIFGSVCSTFGVVLPSFIVIMIVARFYMKFRSSGAVKAAMNGLRPAAVGLIAAALVSVAMSVFLPAGFAGFEISYEFAVSLIIFAVAAALLFRKKANPIIVILVSAGMGVGLGYLGELF